MTIRSDVTIDWESSPRVITVLAPSTEITIQDLVDTCRYNEQIPLNMDDPHLIDAAGKEPLGGSVYVGITATLQNAVLAFEGRLGPDWVLCKITGGNIVAEDENGDAIDPRLPTPYTTVDRASSSSATLLEEEALQYSSFAGCVTVDKNSSYAGTDFPIGTLQQPVNNFTDAKTIADDRGFNCFLFIDDITIEASDNIRGFNCEGTYHDRLTVTFESGCNVSGTQFNRVKLVGDVGNEFTVFHDRSSLGNISNLDANVYDSELSGTIVLNLDSHRHWTNCYCNQITNHPTLDFNNITQELVMTGYQGGLNVKNFVSGSKLVIYGEALEITLQSTCVGGEIIIIGTGKVIDNSGVGCTVTDDYLVSQYIIESSISTSETNIRGSDSDTLKTISDQIDTLEFSATSSGVAGAVWDQLISSHTISGTFGRLIQDIDTTVNTITADVSTATVSGIAQAVWNELVAFHTISGTFGQYIQDIYDNTQNLTFSGSVSVNPAEIADAVWDEALSDHDTKGSAGASQIGQQYDRAVSLDVVNGESGTSYPIGTHRFPVDNLADALTIASTYNLDRINVHGQLTVGATDVVNGQRFVGHAGWGSEVIFTAGCSVDETSYETMALSGEVTAGDVMLIEDCTIGELSNFSGVMSLVNFTQGSEVSIYSWANIISANAGGDPTNEPELSIGTAAVTVSNYTGNLKITHKTGSNRTVIEGAGANIIIASTCTAGTIQLLGHGNLEADNSGVGCTVDTEGFLSKMGVADQVWDEDKTEHITADSFGLAIQDMEDDLNNPDQYKATVSGLSQTGEYDAPLAAIQADLDNPNQYKADVSALALETTLQDVKTTVEALPTASGIWNYEDRTLTTISGIEIHGVSDWSDAEKNQIRYALGITGAKVATSNGQLEALIKQNRQYNISLEEVRATVDIPVRNVEAGQVDYIIFKIKNDEDSDWSTPVSSGLLYAWYTTLGDTSPKYMKETN